MGQVQDAVAAARKLEEEGRAYYLSKAKSVKGELLKQLFASLAADELNHVKWLDDLMPGVKDAGTANRELFGQLKQVFASHAVKSAVDHAQSDIEILDVAISLEQKVSDVYSSWASSQDDEKLKSLGRVLAGQEVFHKELLQNTKQFLTQPGDWFMKEEGWSFDGG